MVSALSFGMATRRRGDSAAPAFMKAFIRSLCSRISGPTSLQRALSASGSQLVCYSLRFYRLWNRRPLMLRGYEREDAPTPCAAAASTTAIAPSHTPARLGFDGGGYAGPYSRRVPPTSRKDVWQSG
jgi:hypothetical protein